MSHKVYEHSPDTLLDILDQELGIVPTYTHLKKCYETGRVVIKKLSLTQVFHYFTLICKSKKRDMKIIPSGSDLRFISLKIRRESSRRFYWEILVYAQKPRKNSTFWQLCFNLNVEI